MFNTKSPEMKLDHNNEQLFLKNIKVLKVLSVKKTDKKELVYDLKIKDNENYVVKNLGLVHNGGKRAGAGTVALPIWHNDILDFLDMQEESGDMRMRAYDVFPQVTIPDIFMERDKNQEPWVTFCPFEVLKKLNIDIRGLYGKPFEEAYLKIEAAHNQGKLKVSRKHENARDLMKLIMRSQFQTGLPYIAFTDTLNEYNPNKNDDNGHIGIPCVNLCLVGETEIEIKDNNKIEKIRLDAFVEKFELGFYKNPEVKSYDTIHEKIVWSLVTRALLTAETTELIQIESENGAHKIECTPDHKIFTLNRGWVRAKDLIETDELKFLE